MGSRREIDSGREPLRTVVRIGDDQVAFDGLDMDPVEPDSLLAPWKRQ